MRKKKIAHSPGVWCGFVLCVQTLREGRRKTHGEIDVLDIGVPLEFERELVEVPYAHLGLVCPGSDDMIPVVRTFDAVARLWEFEVLNELYGALDVFANRALALGLCCAFAY